MIAIDEQIVELVGVNHVIGDATVATVIPKVELTIAVRSEGSFEDVESWKNEKKPKINIKIRIRTSKVSSKKKLF